MLLTRQFFDSINSNSPDVVNVDINWCNHPKNKHSSSKWKKLVIDLYVAGKEKAIKIRVSNHFATIPSKLKSHRYWNRKFGNTGLIVGIGGVSITQAYQLIKETL